MTKKNELATIDTQELQVVPTAAELAEIMEEMKDMGVLPFGRVQIGAAGTNIFQVTDFGEDNAVVVSEITAVIILNHRSNVLWRGQYGAGDAKTPDCVSFDGVEGVDHETGEIHKCELCGYNKFGSANGGTGRGKACKNTRRLYLMRLADGLRPGDVFPYVLALPSTALNAFDMYRTKVMLSKQKLHGVVTRITLKKAANKDGIAYSTPIFEIVGVLPAGETQRVKQYADAFQRTMNHADLYDEQLDAGRSVSAAKRVPAPTAPASVPPADEDGDDELPFG